MPVPPLHPVDEEERMEVLRRYHLLDTGPEPQFDRIADIAKRQFRVPLALVAFAATDGSVIKANGDVSLTQASRDFSFCAHTIRSDEVLVVNDVRLDERFCKDSLVEAENIRFYAGAPIITGSGDRVGAMCVLDTTPRYDFDETGRRQLNDLAAVVADHLAMRLLVGDGHAEIAARRAAEARAHRLAYHDSLTGLPNRTYLQRVISEGLPFRVDGVLTAFYTDLDAFKAINDMLGHHAGDELLVSTANAIRRVVGPNAFVSHVSGDEFVVLFDSRSPAAAERTAAQLIKEVSTPLTLKGQTVMIGMSVGIACAEPADRDLAALVRRADLALYEAKGSGRSRSVIFNNAVEAVAERRLRLERDLPVALATGDISVHYQPIHRAGDDAMVGVEALARWTHPQLGEIAPAEFIPLAEETSHILDLGRHVLTTALTEARAWNNLFLSVNLSAVQFRLRDLDEQLGALLAHTGFPAERLELEVTESVLHDITEAQRQIDALHGLGVRAVLDDFGTGYSSLSYLRSLPFDKVKIDRSFVRNIDVDAGNHAIVQCIVALAHQLDMSVTAEGVETEGEAAMLRAAGCGLFQGYLFCRPMAARDLVRRLAQETGGAPRRDAARMPWLAGAVGLR